MYFCVRKKYFKQQTNRTPLGLTGDQIPGSPRARSFNCLIRELTVRDLTYQTLWLSGLLESGIFHFRLLRHRLRHFSTAEFPKGLKTFSFTHLSPPLDVKVQSGAYPSGRCRMRQYAKNILLGGPSPKTQKLNKLFSSNVSSLFLFQQTNKCVGTEGSALV